MVSLRYVILALIHKISSLYNIGCYLIIITTMSSTKTCRNPDSSCRPMARKLFAALMDSEDAVLNVLEEGRVASTLGAPLEAGENMYRDLQEVYYSSVD